MVLVAVPVPVPVSVLVTVKVMATVVVTVVVTVVFTLRDATPQYDMILAILVYTVNSVLPQGQYIDVFFCGVDVALKGVDDVT